MSLRLLLHNSSTQPAKWRAPRTGPELTWGKGKNPSECATQENLWRQGQMCANFCWPPRQSDNAVHMCAIPSVLLQEWGSALMRHLHHARLKNHNNHSGKVQDSQLLLAGLSTQACPGTVHPKMCILGPPKSNASSHTLPYLRAFLTQSLSCQRQGSLLRTPCRGAYDLNFGQVQQPCLSIQVRHTRRQNRAVRWSKKRMAEGAARLL